MLSRVASIYQIALGDKIGALQALSDMYAHTAPALSARSWQEFARRTGSIQDTGSGRRGPLSRPTFGQAGNLSVGSNRTPYRMVRSSGSRQAFLALPMKCKGKPGQNDGRFDAFRPEDAKAGRACLPRTGSTPSLVRKTDDHPFRGRESLSPPKHRFLLRDGCAESSKRIRHPG